VKRRLEEAKVMIHTRKPRTRKGKKAAKALERKTRMQITDTQRMPLDSVRNVSENLYTPPPVSSILLQLLDDLQGKIHYRDHKDLYDDMAQRLSKIVKKDEPWTWRYVQSVASQTVAPSKKFKRAVEVLAVVFDEMPIAIANSVSVSVFAEQGTIPEGAFVMGEARRCAMPGCTITFVPTVPWRKYCPVCRPKKG
jgi:hypothetical protein